MVFSCGPVAKNDKKAVEKQQLFNQLALSQGSCQTNLDDWTEEEGLRDLFNRFDSVDVRIRNHWDIERELVLDQNQVEMKSKEIWNQVNQVSPLVGSLMSGQSVFQVLTQRAEDRLKDLRVDYEIFISEKSRWLSRECHLDKLFEKNSFTSLFSQVGENCM